MPEESLGSSYPIMNNLYLKQDLVRQYPLNDVDWASIYLGNESDVFSCCEGRMGVKHKCTEGFVKHRKRRIFWADVLAA